MRTLAERIRSLKAKLNFERSEASIDYVPHPRRDRFIKYAVATLKRLRNPKRGSK